MEVKKIDNHDLVIKLLREENKEMIEQIISELCQKHEKEQK